MKINPKYKQYISILKGASIAILVAAVDIGIQLLNENPQISFTEVIVASLLIGGVKYGNNLIKNKYNFDFSGKVSKYVKYL